jgi:fucose permease
LLPSYHSIFIGFGGLVYTGALITTIARLPCPDLGIGLALRSVKELLSNDPWLFIVVALMNLCYVAAETVPNAYVPKYLCETFVNTTIFHGAVVLSLFWGAMTLGRFACSALLHRGASPRLILGTLAVFSSACLLLAALMDKRIAAEALFIASGLFLSGMFPIIISYSGRLASSSSSAMFILVMAAGMLGASMAGKAVGVLADKISFAAGMTLAVPLALLVLAFSPFLPRHT